MGAKLGRNRYKKGTEIYRVCFPKGMQGIYKRRNFFLKKRMDDGI